MKHKCYILGGGESGTGAAILAKQQGYDVFVSDGAPIKEVYKEELKEHGIDFEERGHTEEKILMADEIMKSPGIPEKSDIMKAIRKKGIPVISEIELAWRYKGKSKIVGITGSNGKTTVTSLTYHICKHAGLDCALVGNIGISIAKQVALDPKEIYVAEISSFQLDDIKDFRAEIGVLTNITEDHLDRSIKYLNKLTLNSNPLPFTMNKEPQKGAFIKDGTMMIAVNDDKVTMSVDDFKIKGKHNQYNTMAAGIAGATLGIRKEKIREAIETFESLEHRMEYVATIKGVEYINDSKATNINSTWFALESMTQPTILILGGVDKGNDYEVLKELVKEKVKAIVCLGTDNRKIHEAFGDDVALMVNTTSAEDAVKAAYHFAVKGDTVLLSPACASFDLFKNYEDRGNQFKKAVREL